MGTHTDTLLPRIGAFLIDVILFAVVVDIVGAVSFISDFLGGLVAALSGVAFFAYFIYVTSSPA